MMIRLSSFVISLLSLIVLDGMISLSSLGSSITRKSTKYLKVPNDPTLSLLRPSNEKSLLVLVQGEAKVFQKWASLLASMPYTDTKADVSGSSRGRPLGGIKLIYASFDIPVNEAHGAWRCNRDLADENATFACDTLFLPNSTWTEGRNALARAAWCAQERQQSEFKYWVFSDDDAELACPGLQAVQHDRRPCWQMFFHFLALEAHPLDLPYIPILLTPHQFYRTGSNFDAMLNAFHGKYAPYMLPYAYMPLGTSWWESQAVLFMVIETCFPRMGVSPASVYAYNEKHREYERGLNVSEIAEITLANYAQYLPEIHTTKRKYDISWGKGAHQWPDMPSAVEHVQAERNSHDASGMRDKCEQLRVRFENFLERKNQKASGPFDKCDILPFMDTYP